MTPQEAGKEAAQEIQNENATELDKRGITLDYLADELYAELNACETKVFLTKKGKLVYSKDLVLWKIRQDARIDAHKLRGDYPAEKREHSGPGGVPLFPVSIEERRILDELKAKLLLEGDCKPKP